MPIGTGRSHGSRTKNAAPGTGAPIGGVPIPAHSGGLTATHIVVSVGPYALVITRPGAHRSTSSAEHASAATTSAVEPSARGDSAETAEGVWCKTLTRSSISKACRSSGNAATDSGTISNRDPCSNAPQISSTEASKAYEYHCDHTCPGPEGSPTCSDPSNCVTLACVVATPLGTPVVPDV